MRGVDVHAEARREFIEARDYLDREPPGRGFLFSEAVERTFNLIRQFPRIGKPLPGGIRKVAILDFDYAIIYQDRGDEVYVVAVAHKRRREDYWRSRL